MAHNRPFWRATTRNGPLPAPDPPRASEVDVGAVISSTPKSWGLTNNRRDREVDRLLAEQQAEKAMGRAPPPTTSSTDHAMELGSVPTKVMPAAETPAREDSMALLRKLSRVASVSPRANRQTAHTESRYPIPQPARSALEVVVPAFREQREYGEDTIGALEDIMKTNTTDSPESQSPAASPEDKSERFVGQRGTFLPKPALASKHMITQRHSSALDEIVQQAKNEPQADESIIASLENIVNPITEPSSSNLTLGAIQLKEADDFDGSENLTQLEKDRRQERLALESLNKRLQSTRTTIKDANRGLRRIENKIEEVEAVGADTDLKPLPASEAARDSAEEAPKPGGGTHVTLNTIVDHKKLAVCSHCGRGDTSVWFALWTELRDNFYTYEPANGNRIHITWLGWTLITWLFWLMLEAILATQYSDYVYGPIFPFVTFNRVVRGLIFILQPFFTFLSWALGCVSNLLFGEVAASTKSPRATPAGEGIDMNWMLRGTRTRTFALLSATASRAARSTAEALDDIGRAWDDGYSN